MCKCDNVITLAGNGCCFREDEEPYGNNVIEEVTEEESTVISNIDFHVTATLCMKCKKVYFWGEDGSSLGEQELS